MHDHEKSDRPELPVKPPNKPGEPTAADPPRREGDGSLLVNQVQADDCFCVQRVECAPAARAAAAPGGWIVGSRADVARRVVAQGSTVFERGVPLSAWRVARPVPVFGGVLGWAQSHDLRAGGGGGGVRGACRRYAAQRGVVVGDLADQRGAVEAPGVGVMVGGRVSARGGRRGREHGRVDAGGGQR